MRGRRRGPGAAAKVWRVLKAPGDFVFNTHPVVTLLCMLTAIFAGAFGTAFWAPFGWVMAGVAALVLLPMVVEGGVETRHLVADIRRPKTWFPPDLHWNDTPLAQPDPTPPEPVVTISDKASLDAALSDWRAQGQFGRYVSLYVPAYRKLMRFQLEDSDVMAGVEESTARTIANIQGWREAERKAVRRLLIADAIRRAADEGWEEEVTEAGVEELVTGAVITIYEGLGSRSRLASMGLEAPWTGGHGLQLIVRDGRPVAVASTDDWLEEFDVPMGAAPASP